VNVTLRDHAVFYVRTTAECAHVNRMWWAGVAIVARRERMDLVPKDAFLAIAMALVLSITSAMLRLAAANAVPILMAEPVVSANPVFGTSHTVNDANATDMRIAATRKLELALIVEISLLVTIATVVSTTFTAIHGLVWTYLVEHVLAQVNF